YRSLAGCAEKERMPISSSENSDGKFSLKSWNIITLSGDFATRSFSKSYLIWNGSLFHSDSRTNPISRRCSWGSFRYQIKSYNHSLSHSSGKPDAQMLYPFSLPRAIKLRLIAAVQSASPLP